MPDAPPRCVMTSPVTQQFKHQKCSKEELILFGSQNALPPPGKSDDESCGLAPTSGSILPWSEKKLPVQPPDRLSGPDRWCKWKRASSSVSCSSTIFMVSAGVFTKASAAGITASSRVARCHFISIHFSVLRYTSSSNYNLLLTYKFPSLPGAT
jgi:hypothetical protein